MCRLASNVGMAQKRVSEADRLRTRPNIASVSPSRRALYLTLLILETLVGVPMVALLELYMIGYQPQAPLDWGLAVAWQVVLIGTLVLTIVAWRKVLR